MADNEIWDWTEEDTDGFSTENEYIRDIYEEYGLQEEGVPFDVFYEISSIDPEFSYTGLSETTSWLIKKYLEGTINEDDFNDELYDLLDNFVYVKDMVYRHMDTLSKFKKYTNINMYEDLNDLYMTVQELLEEDDMYDNSSFSYKGSEDSYGLGNDKNPSTDSWDSWESYFNRNQNDDFGHYEKIEKNSDVLVIHPDDRSTDCLKVIYEGRGWDVLTDVNTPSDEILRCINEHDRIIMLGHGSGSGLMRPGRGGYMVDSRHADALRGKTTFSIWCFSDEYFRKYNIRGFHTGMIISEVHEAAWNKIKTTQDIVDRDNALLSDCFKNCIDMEPEQIQEYMLEHYKAPEGEYDPVIEFNRKNFDIIY